MRAIIACLRRALLLLPVFVLVACSGGGGGGGGGQDNTHSFSVSPNSLGFAAVENGAAPAPQTVQVTVNAGTLYFEVTGSGATGALTETYSGNTLTIQVQPAAPNLLGVGVHTGTITITGYEDALGNIPVPGGPQTVSVAYTVTSGLTTSVDSFNWTYISGYPVPPDTPFGISDTQNQSYAWNAAVIYQSGTDWVRLNGAQQVSGQTLPEAVGVSYSPPAGLGTYNAIIRVTGNGKTRDVPVTLTHRLPQISVTPSYLTFESTAGAPSAPPVQQIQVTGESLAWNVSASEPWVTLTVAGGHTPGPIGVGVNASGLAAGIHTATVTVTDTVGNVNHDVGVTLYLEPHRLQVSDNGVALAGTATLSRLSHTVTVSENAGTATAWSAASDQAWLSVTPGGTTDGDLVLTANPAGLAPEQIHYATVTVNSNDPTISNTETVRVGLYVSAASPANSLSVNTTGFNVVADPVRPYVYVTGGSACSGSPGVSSNLEVYNIYTGALVTTIAGPADSYLSEMTVSSDGQTLYVLDSSDGNIIPLDLTTWQFGSKWYLLNTMRGCAHLAYARPNGRGVIVGGNRRIYSETGQQLAGFTDDGVPNRFSELMLVAASQDGKNLFGISTSWNGLVRYALRYPFLQPLSAVQTHSFSLGSSYIGLDMAVNATGSRVFVSANLNSGIYHFDGNMLFLALSPAGFSTNAEVGPTGKLYVGGGSFSPSTVYTYNDSGTGLGSFNVPYQTSSRQLAVSGDGLRVVTRSIGKISFTTVTP
ncbi:hypothetical protein SCL_1427 [Sulfuricaulis limicola]|uniref:BACON domain-containing protein n=1 Tax=Sulfuricaulis limicola TaxID=1620215 RepID=A0A1B4XG09_9GAMM|nr:BACON domain-containing protein [Sulfuricaulis limicola]BAV33738.1 hypothetical protein SCL_1427 [Sulfuricaulis limicola]